MSIPNYHPCTLNGPHPSPAERSPFQVIAERVAPADKIELTVPLFSNRFAPSKPEGGSWKERAEYLKQIQTTAVGEVLAQQGLNGVIELALRVENANVLGQIRAEATGDKYDAIVIPSLLVSSDNAIAMFALAFAATRIHADVGAAKKREFDSWTSTQVAAFVALFPFERATWDSSRDYPIPSGLNIGGGRTITCVVILLLMSNTLPARFCL